MKKAGQNIFYYKIAQIAAWFVAKFIFKREMLRNEIKGKKGPFVVIANHQAALDFANLIGTTSTPLTFVISNSFYNTLPIKGIMEKIGVIPKQQFQTTPRDMKRMKAVIDDGRPLVIYPAGLMCEDGLSTPIPSATYKFLKWINADIYVARSYGTYFATPKWAKGVRTGKTYLDVYKLFSKEELIGMDIKKVKEKTDEALLFDAYREQEERQSLHKNGDNIEGLENVLYMCPHCKNEFTVRVKDGHTIYCTECGFEQKSDKYAFLHKQSPNGEELRYVSDWSRLIYEDLKQKIINGEEQSLSADTEFYMIDYDKNKFTNVGKGSILLTRAGFTLSGEINSEQTSINIPVRHFASLPFSPGKHFEIQQGDTIYRCVLADGRKVMKFINTVKIFYELSSASREIIKA